MIRSPRSAFTLMELLLVIAILAIVAAIAAPQFFRTSSAAIDDARAAMLKANYAAIKAAVNMRVWDEINNPAIPTSPIVAAQTFLASPTATNLDRQKILIAGGYVTESAFQVENSAGKKFVLTVNLRGATPTPAFGAGVASAPLFMETASVFVIGIADAALPATELTLLTTTHTLSGGGSGGSIDACLSNGKTWAEIWDAVKAL